MVENSCGQALGYRHIVVCPGDAGVGLLPLFGPEGALSAFDTQLSTNLFWEKADRVFNNRIEGGGVNEFQQDLATFDTDVDPGAKVR